MTKRVEPASLTTEGFSRPSGIQSNSAVSDSVVVALSGSENSKRLVLAGAQLAQTHGTRWEAIHIETPDNSAARAEVAEALGFAAEHGATIATVPAATVIDGLETHLRSSPAGHIVLGGSSTTGVKRLWRRSIVDAFAARCEGVVLHIYTRDAGPEPDRRTQFSAARSSTPPIGYVYALAFVAGTLLVAEALQFFTGPRSLDLLFLFPVIAVAARLGYRPALVATAASVVGYNYFLLAPAFSFDVRAPQNLVMAAVLIGVAAYTSILTARMRGRISLGDRSARENASIAALAQRLTRDSDWDSTALTICEHVHSLLRVRTILLREVGGELQTAAAVPSDTELGPLERTALAWVWTHGEEGGAGTEMLSAADWQFQPLKTSLGMLAVLGLARDDGRDPVRPDQRILLSTLVAQAALALERLRLEESMRSGSPTGGAEVPSV